MNEQAVPNVPQVHQEANPEASAPVQVSAAPITKGDTLGQVITVTSSKGGSGKSNTLATYLAHSSQNDSAERGTQDGASQESNEPETPAP